MKDESSAESVLKEYQFNCGCSEVCFSFRVQKVGRSSKTFCDGSVMSRSYRRGFLHGFSKIVGKDGKLVRLGN